MKGGLMTKLVWDKAGDHNFEYGLDRGVLYLQDGSGVVWNGLTEIDESFSNESQEIFFDGRKINDFVKLGNFSATMRAVTYPDEFMPLEGIVPLRPGLFLRDQKIRTFGLCYRTLNGNDLEGVDGYTLHVIYNVTAIPTDTTFSSLSDDPELVEFEWDITSIPSDTFGYRPTSHLLFDSRKMDPWLLEDLEEMLYGSAEKDPSLADINDLIDYVDKWFRLKIIDHGDGTWSAIEYVNGYNIRFLPEEEFEIINANAEYISDDEYAISDVMDVTDIPRKGE
jgi:hypothetical protein